MNFKRSAVLSGLLVLFLADGAVRAQVSLQEPTVYRAVEILSDLPREEMDAFVGKVLPDLVKRTKQTWYPLIPEEACPPKNEQGKVAIEFVLHPDGKISEMRLSQPSGKVALDRAAWGALTGAQPFKVLPPELAKETIRLRFNFVYNISEVVDPFPDIAVKPAHPEKSSPVN